MRVLMGMLFTVISVSATAQSRILAGYQVVPDYRTTAAEPHATGASLAFSKRQLVGGRFIMEDAEADGNGIDQNESENDQLSVRWYQPFASGFVSEIEVKKFEGEDQDLDPVAPSDESEGLGFQIVGGLQVPNTNSAFGFLFGNLETEDTDGTSGATSDIGLRTLGVSYGHKLNEGLHFATGLLQFKISPDSGSGLETNIYFIGIGKIWGTEDKPAMVGELVLNFFNEYGTQLQEVSLQGLVNQSFLQYTGGASISRSDSDSDDTLGLQVSGGVNYDFSDLLNYYFGPRITVAFDKTDESEGGLSDSKERIYELRLEAGIKKGVHHMYARYDAIESKETETGSSPTETKESETKLSIGYDYVF